MTMKKFIEAKSDQLNADDLIGANMIIKITKVRVTETGQQDCTIWYEGNEKKPWKPCKTMGRVLVAAWGENPQNYVGKHIELSRDSEVIFGGAKVGGIRIAALSDIDADFEIALTISRGFKKPVKIKKLKSPTPVADVNSVLAVAGSMAAEQGVEKYTIWGSALTPEQKTSLKPYLSDWLKKAKAADVEKENTNVEE